MGSEPRLRPFLGMARPFRSTNLRRGGSVRGAVQFIWRQTEVDRTSVDRPALTMVDRIGGRKLRPSCLQKAGGEADGPLGGKARRKGSGFDRGFAAEGGSGDKSNDKTDGQRLHEYVGHVDEGVLVKLLRALYGCDLARGGGGGKSGGLDLVNLRGEVAVHKVGHEVEVDDLPHGNVANGGDGGDQEAAGESTAEGDLASEGVVPVAADAEVDEQERGHHHGVAQSHAVPGA